jgi:hypothetical protein
MADPTDTSLRIRVRDVVVNALIGLIAAIVLMNLTGTWASKESRAAHDADMQSIGRRMDFIDAGQQRILDALCDQPVAVKSPRTCTTR